jgi:ABC-type branched-subunit amino acid transport system ATPase component
VARLPRAGISQAIKAIKPLLISRLPHTADEPIRGLVLGQARLIEIARSL